jgi:hypothetical protein
MVINQYLPNNKNMDTLKFRLSLAQGLMEKNSSAVSCPVYGHPSLQPPPKTLTARHFLERIPTTGKKAKLKKEHSVLKTWEKEGIDLLVY